MHPEQLHKLKDLEDKVKYLTERDKDVENVLKNLEKAVEDLYEILRKCNLILRARGSGF